MNHKHGDSAGRICRLYSVWQNMKSRCDNPKASGYGHYGGRGILVAKEWSVSYSTFKLWATSNGYEDGLEIDRIDNNGHYEPSNCRWVTRSRNMRNKRTNLLISAFGETKCMADWVADERCVVKRRTLHERIRRGWNPERAIRTAAL